MAEGAHGFFGVGVEQAVAAGGDHDRVEHDDRRLHLGEPALDGRRDLDGAEHADLDRVDLDVVADRAQLRVEERGGGTCTSRTPRVFCATSAVTAAMP